MSKIIDLKDKLGNKLYPFSVIKQEKNENGEYVKYSNGDMVCRMTPTITIQTNEWATWGSIYSVDKNVSLPFPKEFIDTPILEVTKKGLSTEQGAMILSSMCEKDKISIISLGRGSVPARTTFTFNIVAYGKWK